MSGAVNAFLSFLWNVGSRVVPDGMKGSLLITKKDVSVGVFGAPLVNIIFLGMLFSTKMPMDLSNILHISPSHLLLMHLPLPILFIPISLLNKAKPTLIPSINVMSVLPIANTPLMGVSLLPSTHNNP